VAVRTNAPSMRTAVRIGDLHDRGNGEQSLQGLADTHADQGVTGSGLGKFARGMRTRMTPRMIIQRGSR